MSVRTRGNKLVIDFRCLLPDGRKVRCVESEGDNTPKNLARVQAKWKSVEYAIKYGRFDYKQFFPHGSKIEFFENRGSKTLGEFWEEVMTEKEGNIKPGTLQLYRGAEKHILPYLGHYELGQIGEGDILLFRGHLVGFGFKNSTINAYIMALCMALKKAHRRGLVSEYPCEGVNSLAQSKPDIEPFSREEMEAIISVLDKKYPEWKDLITLWLFTGLRPGEMLGLEWKDVDFFNSKLMIRRSMDSITGEVKEPKTVHSVRDIPLTPEAMAALKNQYARTGLQFGVIWQEKGKRITHTILRDRFSFFLKLAGIKQRPPKNMRHTFATLAIASGENVNWIASVMGHSSPHITMDKYTRFVPNITRQDGSALGALFTETGSNKIRSLGVG